MYRDTTCGELRLADAGKRVKLAGWVQRARKMGGMTFVDIRDRYGLTQAVFSNEKDAELAETASHLGREYVIQVEGEVAERSSKNPNLPTGEVEVIATGLRILNKSEVPPFTIEDNTDGGDDLRMKYRYLDLRRPAVRSNLELRHRMAFEIRRYLDSQGFLEVENQVLKSMDCHGTIIATGGSAVYSDEGMAHLASLGTVVYLRLGYDALCERLSDFSERGVVMRNGMGMSLRDLFDERKPLYEQYAEVTVDVGGLTITEAALKVANAIEGAGANV